MGHAADASLQRGRRPDKPAPLQPLGVKGHANPVVPEDLDQRSAPSTKDERSPTCGSRFRSSWTSRAKPCTPFLMSVRPVANHTRTPLRIGITGPPAAARRPAPLAPRTRSTPAGRPRTPPPAQAPLTTSPPPSSRMTMAADPPARNDGASGTAGSCRCPPGAPPPPRSTPRANAGSTGQLLILAPAAATLRAHNQRRVRHDTAANAAPNRAASCDTSLQTQDGGSHRGLHSTVHAHAQSTARPRARTWAPGCHAFWVHEVCCPVERQAQEPAPDGRHLLTLRSCPEQTLASMRRSARRGRDDEQHLMCRL